MKKLREKVMQLIGEASMLWEPIPKGVFESSRGIEIGEKFLSEIEVDAKDAYALDPDKIYLIKCNPAGIYDVDGFIKGLKHFGIKAVFVWVHNQDAVTIAEKKEG